MSAPVPYFHFAGTAAAALDAWQQVFGGQLARHTFADFGREDGPADAIAHGELRGPVDLFAADAAVGETVPTVDGVLFALLGAADAATSRRWFDDLADGGTVVDPLTLRPWGDHDGQVRDRFGVTWLIGFQGDDAADADADS